MPDAQSRKNTGAPVLMPLQTRWGPGITLLNFQHQGPEDSKRRFRGWWAMCLLQLVMSQPRVLWMFSRLAPQDGDVDYDSYVRDKVWFRSAAFLQGPGAVAGYDSHSAGPGRLLPARLLSGPRGPGQRFPPAKKKKGLPARNTCKGSSEVLAWSERVRRGASRPPRLSTSPPSPFVPLRLQKKRSALSSPIPAGGLLWRLGTAERPGWGHSRPSQRHAGSPGFRVGRRGAALAASRTGSTGGDSQSNPRTVEVPVSFQGPDRVSSEPGEGGSGSGDLLVVSLCLKVLCPQSPSAFIAKPAEVTLPTGRSVPTVLLHALSLSAYLKRMKQTPVGNRAYFYAHFRDEETEVKVT